MISWVENAFLLIIYWGKEIFKSWDTFIYPIKNRNNKSAKNKQE